MCQGKGEVPYACYLTELAQFSYLISCHFAFLAFETQWQQKFIDIYLLGEKISSLTRMEWLIYLYSLAMFFV